MPAATVTSPPKGPTRGQIETGVLSGLIVAGTVAGAAFLLNRKGAAAGLVIETASVPVAASGFSYSAPLAASGGVPPYSWAVTSGTLPPGLQLGADGNIAGIPTSLGTFTFSATVTDSSHSPLSAEEGFTILVAQGEAISTTVLPPATVGKAYSATLVAVGGTAPYSWVAAGGALPGGLSLSAAGVVSGTPTASGNFGFTAQATDSSTPPEVRLGTIAVSVQASGSTTGPPPPTPKPPTPTPPPTTGKCLMGCGLLAQVNPSEAVWITDCNCKRWGVPSTAVLNACGYNGQHIYPVTQAVLDATEEGGVLTGKGDCPPLYGCNGLTSGPCAGTNPGTGGGGWLKLISDGGNRWGLLDSGGTLHVIRNPRLAMAQGYRLSAAKPYSPSAFAKLPIGTPLV